MNFLDFSANGSGTLAIGLLIAGVVAGLAEAALGLGCGLVLVPALYVVLSDMSVAENVRLPMAIATGMAASLPAALSLLHRHRSRKEVEWSYVRRYAWLAAGAVLLAAMAACLTPEWIAVTIFALGALIYALWLIFGGEAKPLREAPHQGRAGGAPHLLFAAMGGFTGMGGALLCKPYLTLSGVPEPRATGTAAAFDAAVCLAGIIVMAGYGFYIGGLPEHSLGFVNLPAFALTGAAAFIAATLAAPIAEHADAGRLGKVFALLVLFSAGKMAWTALMGM